MYNIKLFRKQPRDNVFIPSYPNPIKAYFIVQYKGNLLSYLLLKFVMCLSCTILSSKKPTGSPIVYFGTISPVAEGTSCCAHPKSNTRTHLDLDPENLSPHLSAKGHHLNVQVDSAVILGIIQPLCGKKKHNSSNRTVLLLCTNYQVCVISILQPNPAKDTGLLSTNSWSKVKTNKQTINHLVEGLTTRLPLEAPHFQTSISRVAHPKGNCV